MNRCPISYQECAENLYSTEGLKVLSPALSKLSVIAYSAEELKVEAMQRAATTSIPGIRPKVCASLNIRDGLFEPVAKNGKYILKPQHPVFPFVPENEDLTMRMAETIGIDVPVHGMVWLKGNSLSYFIKRFDRAGQKDRIAVEDFAQLAGLTRETKYNYPMEKLVRLLDKYCTFPAIEKAKLFTRVVFNFLAGNEDMHMKNYSLITRNGKTELSPAYNFLNTTLLTKGEPEEIALPLRGKIRNITRNDLVTYFGNEQCGLPEKITAKILQNIQSKFPEWKSLLEISFLPEELKEKYRNLLQARATVLNLKF